MSDEVDTPQGRAQFRLLIVDDDPADIELVCDLLEHDTTGSYAFLTASSYARGLELLSRERPDVALVDYHLGARSGVEFIAEAAAAAPGVPVVLLTGAGDPEVDRRAMVAGAVDYVPKADMSADRLERTVRYAVERARRHRAETRSRALLESGHDLISIIGSDGSLLYVSPSISRILGFHPGEKVATGVMPEVHPDDRSRVETALKRIVGEGAGATIRLEPYRVRHADGSWRVLDTIATNHLADPAIGGVVAHSRDMTRQVQTQERMAFQAHLLKAVGQAVIATDLEGTVLFWNPAAEEIYGWSAEEALGQDILGLTTAETTKAQATDIMDALRRGESWTGEFTVSRKDGTSFTALVTDSPILDDAGNLAGVIGVSSDISRLKETEDALRERVKELRALHGASRVLNRVERPLEERLQDVVELMPPGWLYPAITEARLTFDDRTYATAAFRETPWSMVAPVDNPGGGRGELEVVLTEARPERDIGPFLHEERDLLDNLARLVSDVLKRERLARTLAGSFAALEEAVLVTQNGLVVEANPATERIFGYSPGELIGQTTQVLHVDAPAYARFADESAAALAADGVFHGSYPMRRKDGSRFHAEQSVSLLDRAEGLAGGAVSVVRDVSERVRADTELRASEERFRQIAEHIKDVFWISNPDKRQLHYVSPAFEHIWGMPVRILMERPTAWMESILPSDRARVDAALSRESEGSYVVEYRIVRPDGQVRWIQDRGFPVVELGQVRRIVGVAEDITDRKIAEERWTVLSREIAEGIHVLHPDGHILFATPAGERVLGHEGGLMGRDVMDLVHPEDRARVRDMMREVIADPSLPARALFRGIARDGDVRYLEAVARNRIDHPGIGGILVTTRDVTERHHLEHQLRQSQKMEAVGRLAGGVAHDFNNLLTVIRSETDLILMELEEGDALSATSLAADVENIARSADRAAELTRQLLAFSREQVLQPHFVDLSEVVGESVRLLHRLIGENIELVTDLSSGLPSVRVDPGQLESVVVNLAVNARDAMPTGGTLTLRTSTEVIDAGEAEARGRAFTRAVILEVEDTGTGMDDNTRDRIFEPFFTTKPLGKGTGLGLAMVYGVVAQSGGVIQVESEPGRGTVFCLAFPAFDAAPTQRVEEPRRQEPQDLEGVRILVVEDDEAVRRVTVRILERAGITVVATPTAEQGLEAIAREGRFDLILTDLVLPGMSGREMVQRLAGDGVDGPFAVMSGYAEGAVGEHADLPGGVTFIEKPFTRARLLEVVRELVASSRSATR